MEHYSEIEEQIIIQHCRLISKPYVKQKKTHTHTDKHPPKGQANYDDGSQKVASGVGDITVGKGRGAGRGRKEFSGRMAMFSILSGWWLQRDIQLSKVIKLNTYAQYIFLYVSYSSAIKRRLELCINHSFLYQYSSILVYHLHKMVLLQRLWGLSSSFIQKMDRIKTFIHLFGIKCLGIIRAQLKKRNRASREQWDKHGGRFSLSKEEQGERSVKN